MTGQKIGYAGAVAISEALKKNTTQSMNCFSSSNKAAFRLIVLTMKNPETMESEQKEQR